MKTAEIVAVQVAGDGVFVEFADGIGSFFPANFLRAHRQSNPNQLFVSEAEGEAATRAALFALPPKGFGRDVAEGEPRRPLLLT